MFASDLFMFPTKLQYTLIIHYHLGWHKSKKMSFCEHLGYIILCAFR